ncbi:hypothetical protein PR048_016987 [Dryococelus australis]|uniref:MADF domain-containing protein n=1 Tax=Dryococelus australis TaxID=614101 RepID=A0ABQ9H887_9NEOP|nr:hypothetical protein PR048_016987 [Dryococelus australis]
MSPPVGSTILAHATKIWLSNSVALDPAVCGSVLQILGDKMEWSNEKPVQFIEDYRSVSQLWDVTLGDYKNNKLKFDTLKQLSNQYDCSVGEVKKIKNLRSAFHREHRRLQKGSSASPMKGIVWFGYDLLTFLHNTDVPRKTMSTACDSEDPELNMFLMFSNVINQ